MPGKRFSLRLPQRSYDIMDRLKPKYGTKTQVVVRALDVLAGHEMVFFSPEPGDGKLYRKCDYSDLARGEWCDDGELYNAEERVEDVYGWPINCPVCHGVGFVEVAADTSKRPAGREEGEQDAIHRND